MLNELLSQLASGQVWSLSALGQRLRVSEELVTQMLCDLEQRGYVERAPNEASCCPACRRGCAGCHPSSSIPGATWRLTDKGRQRASAHRPASDATITQRGATR